MKSDILSGLQILLQLFSIAIIRIGLGLVKWSRERSGEPIESWKIALDRFLSSLIYPQPPGDGGEGFALKAGQKVAAEQSISRRGAGWGGERGKNLAKPPLSQIFDKTDLIWAGDRFIKRFR